MEWNEILETLKLHYQPRGELPVVVMELKNIVMEKDFIDQCIQHTERLPLLTKITDTSLNPLERLGLFLLLEGAHIKMNDVNKKTEVL